MDPRDPICERLGELAADAARDAHGPPDARQWAVIDARMDRRPWRRRLLPLVALSAAAVTLAAVMVARRPLDYRVQGCAEVTDGASCAGSQGVVSFSDGTHVTLDAQTRIHIEPLAFGRGAKIALDDGNASLAVVHRAQVRWTVTAGPYRVQVTGTRFRVEWAKAKHAMSVSVTEGEVHVSGGSLKRTAVLHAGQSLHAGPETEAADDTRTPPREGDASARKDDTPSAAAPPPRAATRRSDRPHRASAARPQPAPLRLAESGSPAEPPPPPVAAPGRRFGQSMKDGWDEDETGLGLGTAGTPAQPALPVVPRPRSVVFSSEGSLSGAMTGATWLARGDGTKLSAPVSGDRLLRLRPQANGLCASGTVAGLRCVNEDTPQIRCNWDTNWGVDIGFCTRRDEEAWGDGAAKRIAVEFHGRQASYRLIAHRKGGPHEGDYCIENYRSGQPVTASMFKKRCWEDAGDTLPSFANVDSFSLRFLSGMEYVAFHYCVSAIRVDP